MSYKIIWDHFLITEVVKKLFDYKTRHRKRIILLNYLDEFLPVMLPDVQDVGIFCYPQPGNIDPYALENLSNRGAKIFLTNPINTNLFYVEREGILLGSANYNYTKNVIKCHDTVKDVMIFINDWLSIDIDNIVNALDIYVMKESDLIRLKEEHHIFWRTFDGFDDLLKSLVNNKNHDLLVKKDTNSKNKVNELINMVKNLVSKPKKQPETISEKNLIKDVKFGMKDVDRQKSDKPNMNIYCVSKDDLYDMLTDHLRSNNPNVIKKIMH